MANTLIADSMSRCSMAINIGSLCIVMASTDNSGLGMLGFLNAMGFIKG